MGAPADYTVDELTEDPEARLSFLEDTGVFDVDGEEVTTSAGFEDTRSIYADSYGEGEVTAEQLIDTIVDLFGVDRETAAEHVESGEVSRHDVVTFLSLRSFLDRDLPDDVLALLTELATEVGFGSPVPDYMRELTDDTYRAAIDEAGDIVVFVSKYPCDPCRQMKGELPGVLETLPDGVAVAGVDGESVVDFRAEFDVEAAPEVLVFAAGELVTSHRGYTPPLLLVESFDDVYDGVDVDRIEEAVAEGSVVDES